MAGMMGGGSGPVDSLAGLIDFIRNTDAYEAKINALKQAEENATKASKDAQDRLDAAKVAEGNANRAMQAALDEQNSLTDRMSAFASQMEKQKADLASLQRDLIDKIAVADAAKNDALTSAQAYAKAKELTDNLTASLSKQAAELDARESAIADGEKANADLKATLEAKIAKITAAVSD